MSAKGIIIGVFSGLVTGAVLGILFAPHKGRDTRRRIIRQTDEYTDAVKDKFSEFVEVITDKFDNVKKDISDYTDSIKDKIGDIKRTRKVNMN